MSSRDPLEENPKPAVKAASAADRIEVAPGIEHARPTLDPMVGASWSALEAAGLLPKKGVDVDVNDDGWPTETTPSGTVKVIPPPPPPAPSRPFTAPVLAPAAVVLRTEPSVVPAPDPAPTVAVPVPSSPVVARPVENTTAIVAAPRATTSASGRPAAPLVRGPRVVGRTVGSRRIFGRRPRVRKVSRVVRRIDGWTVFKISLVLYALLYVILVIAGMLLWRLANDTGTVDNIQGFVKELFGLKTFVIDGKKLLHASRTLGLIMMIAGTGLHVTLAVLFNLIADLVGGLRVTVLEEEVVLRERDRNGDLTESD